MFPEQKDLATNGYHLQMIQLWKKASRWMRSRASFTVLGIVTIIILILHILPHKHTSSQQDGAPHIDHSTTTSTSPKPSYAIKLMNGKHINPYPYKFTMLPAPCTDQELVIVVHSAVQYFERRAVMRSTWLNRCNLEKEFAMKIKIVFITGITEDNSVQQHVDYEQEMYGDIVQSSFIDSYQNNTFKAISFLRWVSCSKGCPNASMVLKVDDDALIHSVKIPKLNSTIHRALQSNKTDIYLGRLLTTVVNRNNESKWCVSWDLWPHKSYPIWFQGLAYMITPKLAAKLPEIALDTKYMFTDDVYVGVLVSQVEGAEVIIDGMFGTHTESPLKEFLQAFKQEGRIFYHVPSIQYFISWYYIGSSQISYDQVTTPNPKHRISHSAPSGMWIFYLALAICLILLMIVSCFCCFQEECNA